MLAKGRLLGIQFETLFEDGLYMELSRHAERLAQQLRNALSALRVPVLVASPTNQLFPILPDAVLKALSADFSFSYQSRIDASHSCVRICTSWATTEENVSALIEALREKL